ncbi:hypothetical protein [Streptomyces sp. NRRL B-24085]|uniref:hypothetical protein n=1 Tax=Streptomyces sp. NRRL B-24085 TaxID=1709476 RepID=UPI00358FAAC9
MATHANEPAVDVRGLRKRYGNVTAVDGIDLGIRRGGVFGLLGPGGAGRSTTVGVRQGDGDRAARPRRPARARGDPVRKSSGRTNPRPPS